MDHFNWTRREAITKAGLAGGGLVLASGGLKFGVPGFESEEALAAGACIMTPEKTIGPYFVEENLNRSDVRGGQSGTNLTLSMYVFDYANGCAPVSGAKVDIWHANALGKYSDESANGTSGQTWLRGFQTTDANGKVSFTTIFPGFYQGRAVHIHVRVRVGSINFTTQIFFDESQTAAIMATSPYNQNTSNGARLTNANDGIYRSGGDGSQLLVTLASDGSGGYATEFSAGIGSGSSSSGSSSSGSSSGGSSGSGSGSAGSTGSGSTSSGTGTAAAADKAVSVALSAVRVLRYRGGYRTVRVRFKVKETVYVTATVSRGGKALVKRSRVKLTSGNKLVKLKIPRGVPAGAAKLTLGVSDSKGNAKSFSRALHVPQSRS